MAGPNTTLNHLGACSLVQPIIITPQFLRRLEVNRGFVKWFSFKTWRIALLGLEPSNSENHHYRMMFLYLNLSYWSNLGMFKFWYELGWYLFTNQFVAFVDVYPHSKNELHISTHLLISQECFTSSLNS